MCSKCRLPNARMLRVAHATGQWMRWWRLVQCCSKRSEALSQFVNISNLCLVDVLLHCSQDFVVHLAKIWTVRWSLFRWNKVWRVSRRKSSIVSRARCAGALSCWNANSFPDICLMTGNNFTSAARRGNKTVYCHPRLYKKHNSVQPSFETLTDTMTVSLNVGRVRKRRSDACMRSGGGHFEHML